MPLFPYLWCINTAVRLLKTPWLIFGQKTYLDNLHQEKRQQLEKSLKQMYKLMSHKSNLTTYNRLLIYKIVWKPILANINITQKCHNKIPKQIFEASRYIPNRLVRQDSIILSYLYLITDFANILVSVSGILRLLFLLVYNICIKCYS